MTKRKSPAGGGLRCGGAGVGMEIAAKEKARRGRGEVQGEGLQGEAAAGRRNRPEDGLACGRPGLVTGKTFYAAIPAAGGSSR